MIQTRAIGVTIEQREKGASNMADRKPFIGNIKRDEELDGLLESSRKTRITNDELLEQRISFAYGNAPANAKNITKDSVREASKHLLLNAK